MNEPFVFVLTRYLYIKEDVLMSLLISILEKNYDQGLFWASELYFSGFQEEVVEYIKDRIRIVGKIIGCLDNERSYQICVKK